MSSIFINPFSSLPLEPVVVVGAAVGGAGGIGLGGPSRSRNHSIATASGSPSSRPSSSRAASIDSLSLLTSRRSSTPLTRMPAVSAAAAASPTSSTLSPLLGPLTPFATTAVSAPVVDFSRRRSVDVGVLGLGYHRHGAGGNVSRSVRDAVGPDAGDKEDGLIGAGPKGGKNRLLGRHLASILAHSTSLCATPTSTDAASGQAGHALSAIPGSPLISPASSRHPSLSDHSSSRVPSFSSASGLDPVPIAVTGAVVPLVFPVLSLAKRLKLIGNLQSWTFNAMSYTSDELLACVGIMFESLRNMQGVDFDLDQFKSLLLSLRSAYHVRNGYHNFSHATDVTHACYSFLVRMGLAPPLYLLCEDDYDPNIGEGRRKWRRNRAVEEGGMGELLRPMDVFALMVAAIGHDVGHPGLSNAYMVNARTPLAQVYDDKSVLENFHTVTLIHMLRRHNFDYLLGGGFGHLGSEATSFRKVLERSILSTDMSRHFAFVSEINDMGRRFGQKKGASKDTIEDDRLLLCSGLIKCADISNPTRPHRISRAWSTALLVEWGVQASIETEFGLPVSVMCIEPTDSKAQAKSQVGFIDLFAKPLFNAMASVVDEFADFAEKLRDGRIAWEAISLQTDEAYQASSSSSSSINSDWKLSAAPVGRLTLKTAVDNATTPTASPSTDQPAVSFIPITPVARTGPGYSSPSSRSSTGLPVNFNRPGSASARSLGSSSGSPLSPSFAGTGSVAGSSSSIATGNSSFSAGPVSSSSAFSTFSSLPLLPITFPLSAPFDARSFIAGNVSPARTFQVSCDGACQMATAQCEGCVAQETRRGSLGRALAGILRSQEDDEEKESRRGTTDDDRAFVLGEGGGEWPPFPFRPTLGDY